VDVRFLRHANGHTDIYRHAGRNISHPYSGSEVRKFCGLRQASLQETYRHWQIQGGPGWTMAPLATWASAQNALKVAIFRLKIEKKFMGRGQCPQTPASFPLHKSQRLFTLVLRPRAICIHTTASFPTSNGFWRLKRFKQSMEE